MAATRGAVQLIDTATRIENSLKVAGLAGEELTQVYDRLFESAQKNAVPIESMATLYGRLAQAQDALNVSQDEMVNFTDKIGIALRVAGTSAQEASGALLQLSQALGSGIVRAEEYNSINEGARPILQAVAAGMREAGGDVARLRTLVMEGKVSSEAFFRAFEAGSVILEDKVANAELTVSQQFVRLQNVMIDVAGRMNEGTKASATLGDGIENLSDIIVQMADLVEASIEPLQRFYGVMNDIHGAIRNVANEIARITGLEQIGANVAADINSLNIPGLSATSSAHNRVFDATFSLLGETPQDEVLAAILAGETEPAPLQLTVTGPNVEPTGPAQVSLADYPISGAAGTGGGRAGGGSDAYQNALAAQRERLRQLEMETALQRTLNPLVNDYGYAVARLQAQMELENAAAKEGLALTPERRAEIEQLSEQYAVASANAARLAEEQGRVREAAEAMGAAGREALDTIIQGFIDGKNAGEIFAQVLGQLGSALINMGLNGLGTGLGIPGFANGTLNAPGGMALVGERGPELVNLPKGAQVIPNYRTNQMLSGGGASITYAPQIDARGADTAAVARLEQVVARQQVEFEGRVKQIVSSRGRKWR